MKNLKLTSKSGFQISVHIFEPEKSNNKVLLINSATGVKQQVYFSFAKFFSENGFTVITYDYAGIGQSKPRKMRGFEASMRSWGTQDFNAVTQYIKDNFPNHQKFCLGHSVGALILGMNKDSAIFDEFIFVATQDAFIGNLTFKVASTAVLGFGVALPVSTFFLGYFPANWFGLGESLPKNVAFDWRTLILNKKSTKKLYEKIDTDFNEKLDQKTLIIHAEDDSWVTKKGMESLMNKVYPNLQKTYREIKISESEKGEIGHINFFRNYNKNLWNIVLKELS